MRDIFETNLNRLIYKETLLGIIKDTYNHHQTVLKHIKPYVLEGKKPKPLNISLSSIIQKRFLDMWDLLFINSRTNIPERKFNSILTTSDFSDYMLSKFEGEDMGLTMSEQEAIRKLRDQKEYLESQIEDVDYRWFRKSSYRNNYLNSRYRQIGENYTKEYLGDINVATDNYLKAYQDYQLGRRSDPKNRERTMVKALSFENYTRWKDRMTPQDMQNLDYGINEFDHSRYGLKPNADLNPKYLNNDMFARVDRIAQTEIANGYNTATMHQYISKGVTRFRWNTSVKETRYGNCVLCASLDGLIFSYENVPTYIRFPKTKVPYNGIDFVYPPVHPYCSCTVSPITTGEENIDMRNIARTILSTSLATYAFKNKIRAMAKESAEAYMDRVMEHQREKRQQNNYFIPAISILGIGVGTIVYMRNSTMINGYLNKIKDKLINKGIDYVSNKVEEKAQDFIVDKLDELEKQQIDRQTELFNRTIQRREIQRARNEYKEVEREYTTTLENIPAQVEAQEDIELAIYRANELKRKLDTVQYEYAELGLDHKPTPRELRARQLHEELLTGI